MSRSILRLIVCVATGAAGFLVQQTAMAANYTWDITKTGSQAWNTAANWGGSGYPNAAGDVVNLNGNFGAAVTVTTEAGAPTLGVLNWGDSTATYFAAQIGGYNGAGPVTFNNNGNGAQINHSASGPATDNFRANIVLQDNLTINVPSSSYNVKLWGSISQSGGSYGITKTGSGYLTIEPAGGAVSYTGLTTLNGGRIQIANNAGNNAIVGDILVLAGRLQNNNSDAIADTATVTFNGGDWNMGGPGNNETIAALGGTSNTTDIFSGGGTLTLAGNSGTTSYSGRFGVNATLALSKTGGSTQTLAGTNSNSLTSVSVTGGILQLGKTAGVNALSGSITLGNGAGAGKIRLLAADQINDTSTFTFNAGTLDTNGVSETVGTLTNSGASTIDMGAGASVLKFADSSGQTWSGTIQILNWSGLPTGGGTDQLFFGANASGLTAAQIGMLRFVNPAGYAPGTYGGKILPSGEVVVPEPAILGTLGLSSLLFLRRRHQA